MTLILLNAFLPIFVGLLLGYIAGRRQLSADCSYCVGAFSLAGWMLVMTKFV